MIFIDQRHPVLRKQTEQAQQRRMRGAFQERFQLGSMQEALSGEMRTLKKNS
jgi:hypothetical protein